jgi:DNA topoisomerase-1
MVPVTRDDKGKLLAVAGCTDIPDHLAHAAIPPAWSQVLVDPDPTAKLIATGYDAKGRRQSLYSREYRAAQDSIKFSHTNALLPQAASIRSQVESDVLVGSEAATVALLILETGIRPGSMVETGGDTQAYGATTLLASHVVSQPDGTVRLNFTGKKGVAQSVLVTHPWLASIITKRAARLEHSASRFLFHIDERDLRRYVATLGDGTIRPKDFRTMLGTATAHAALADQVVPETKREAKALVKATIATVSAALGNTPTVARKSYVCPSVLAAFAK